MYIIEAYSKRIGAWVRIPILSIPNEYEIEMDALKALKLLKMILVETELRIGKRDYPTDSLRQNRD